MVCLQFKTIDEVTRRPLVMSLQYNRDMVHAEF